MLKTVLIYSILLILFSIHTYARPHYAARAKSNSCTMCHVSPLGGGLKTVTGKAFGGRGLKLNQFATQDKFAVDMRGIYYHPKKASSARGGMGLMALNVGANLNLTPMAGGDETSDVETRLVATHNIAGFTGIDSHNVYLRFKMREDYEASWKPQYIMLGRFQRPFGLMTDEHRTYTKMMTKSEWYTQETGVVFSANPYSTLHYDLGIINGIATEANFDKGNAIEWGGSLNARWTPISLPIVLGASYSQHSFDKNSTTDRDQPVAGSVYSVVLLDPILFDLTTGSIQLEYSEAKYWNPEVLPKIFEGSSPSEFAKSRSEGWFGLTTINVNPTTELQYKYDRFLPDREFRGSYIERHGFGIKHYFSSSINVQLRYENANNAIKNINSKYADDDAFYAVLRVSL
ncbi:MAG: hypothetical protein MK008_00740 [Bdellovibrionales bacterium]|nr:hypothetical protein [Bdellovibrionales bacterium]